MYISTGTSIIPVADINLIQRSNRITIFYLNVISHFNAARKNSMGHFTLSKNSDSSLYTIKDSGVYLEKRFAGVRFLSVKGLNTGTLDMSENLWGHKVIIT